MTDLLFSPIPLAELKEMIKGLLSEIHLPESKPAEIIDRAELCKRLAITEPTVIRLEKKGDLPVIRLGSSIRYNWPVVLEFLEGRTEGKLKNGKNVKRQGLDKAAAKH